MKKEEFLRELEYLLSDLPEDEREEAVEYYRDYLDEADWQDEEEPAGRLGSPERAAAEIRAGLSGGSQGEFTERGYQDERFRENYHAPDQYAKIVTLENGSLGKDRRESKESWETEEERESGESGWTSFEKQGKSCREEWSKWRKEREQRFERAREQRGGRQEERREQRESGEPRWWEYKGPGRRENRGLIIFLLLLFFGIPTAGAVIGAGFSLIGGILGGIFGIFGGVFSLVAAAFAAALGVLAGGIALIFSGAADFSFFSASAVSLMSIGCGFLLLALAMLLFLLTKWGCGTAVPWMIRLIRDIVRAGIGWLREIWDRIFGNRRDRL